MTTQINEQQPPLRRADLLANPLQQFERWWQQAGEQRVPDREAMTLATIDADGTPSARMVLLRGHSSRGFVFFGNYNSRKGQAIVANNRVALLFFWPMVYRQIRIEGVASKLPLAESQAYFASRPRQSQLGAWASQQSAFLENRQQLYERLQQFEQKFAGQAVPYPEFWGGWLVEPQAMEFWQGQPHRLHDRFRYQQHDNGWSLTRLAP